MGQDLQNSYFLILFGAALLHGLYLSLIISVKSNKGSGQQWLALTLFGISALLANYFIFISGAVQDYPHLLNLFLPFVYVTGPAFYLFIRKSEDKSFSFKWFDLIHLLPIIWVLWETIMVAQWPVEMKLRAVSNINEAHTPGVLQILIGNRFNLITAIYVFISLYYLGSRKSESSKQGIRIQWLRKFSWVFFSLLICSVLLPMIFVSFSIPGAYLELIVTILFSLSIHVLSYVILKHEKNPPWLPFTGKYQTSPLNAALMSNYKVKLMSHLDHIKPWLNPNFTINDLATQLSIPKHHLSQVLNEEISMSFVDLVNSYRVEAAKAMLTSGALEKYSVMGIAADCGFASKSTFNRTFKKFTGLTPSAFLSTSKVPIQAQ